MVMGWVVLGLDNGGCACITPSLAQPHISPTVTFYKHFLDKCSAVCYTLFMTKYQNIDVTAYEIEYNDIGNITNRDDQFLASLLEQWFAEHSVRIVSAARYERYGAPGYHLFYEGLEETPLLSDSLQTDTGKW